MSRIETALPKCLRPRWFIPVFSAYVCVSFAAGCGGSDSTGTPSAMGGSGGSSGAGGADASFDAAGSAGKGGTIAVDASDAKAGSGGSTEGGAQDVIVPEADSPSGCKNDNECKGNSAGPYCDTATGQCVQCKPSDSTTCAVGSYCDPATLKCVAGCDTAEDCPGDAGLLCDPTTHQCVGCLNDTACPLGQVCNPTSKICEAGCNAMHGCETGLKCCSGQCTDTDSDQDNCGACGTVCSLPNAFPLCVGAKCVINDCKTGFQNCDLIATNGCEAPSTDGGSACACEPNEIQDCYTGAANTLNVGACQGGLKTCNAQGTAWGACLGQVLPAPETCYTAVDDDCNGQVNEGGVGCACTPNATESCYTGPSGTRNVGACKDGNWTCNALGTAWSACIGQVLPTPETCLTQVDDNCNGQVNEPGGSGCSCAPNSTHSCYSGPPGTEGVGVCQSGTQKCDALGAGYGPCTGDITPSPDICTDNLDNDCNGVVNDGFGAGATGCVCYPLAVSSCYSGPAGTDGVGICKAGSATCNGDGTAQGACSGEVVPATDHCTDSLDNDCSGVVNDGFGKGGTGCVCTPGAEQSCYTGPTGTLNVGVCKAGKSTCAADGKAWGPCLGQIIPDLDSCLDTLDNDCNGIVNDGNHLAPGCACIPGTIKCVNGLEVTCNAQGDWGPPGGLCNQICKAGEFSCDCNTVMMCNVGPPASWVPKVPSTVCNAATGQRCDAATGTCKQLTPLGTTTPTGTYYRYANFTSSNSPLKISTNVDDVDSYGDYVYINRGPWYSQGIAMDVYRITLLDTDGDGKLEPNQHPDNPLDPGPIEQRTLTWIATYTTAAPDNAPMGIAHRGEMWATSDRVFMLSAPNQGDIKEYILSTKVSNVVADSTVNFPLSVLGRGDQDNRWYAGYEGARRVYSFCPNVNAWMAEFMYPDLAGSHMDGLEVIVAPSTQVQYVYVSDMTSDFLGQYRRDGNGYWVQTNVFRYVDASAANVEGLGFGALGHFWVTSGNSLYEIGGGDLTNYLQ